MPQIPLVVGGIMAYANERWRSAATPNRLFRALPGPARLTAAALTGLTLGACSPEVGTSPSTKPRAGSITIEHDGPVFGNWRAYVLAFNAANPATSIGLRPNASCGADYSLHPAPGDARAASGIEDGRLPIGAIHVWAPYNYDRDLDPALLSMLFNVPHRFLGGDVCQGWRFGDNSGWTPDDGQSEYPLPPQPGEPPPGMDQNEYNGLPNAEKKLVWDAFVACGANVVCFGHWMDVMRGIRSEAENWARQWSNGVGAKDGQEDALRHSYWQCRLSQQYGSDYAMKWGDAHESESLEPASTRMDLHNNAVGRKVSQEYPSCADGIIAAWHNDRLQLAVANELPSLLSPVVPEPPRPPAS